MAVVFIAIFIVSYLVPVYSARQRLDELREKQQPEACYHGAKNEIPGALTRAQQTNDQSEAESRTQAAGQQPKENEIGACLTRRQILLADRANDIAIEGAVSSTANTFIAYIAALVSLVALALAAVNRLHGSADTICLQFNPRVPGADDGGAQLHNRGAESVLLEAFVVNGADFIRSVSSDGLIEIRSGQTVEFPVHLRDDGKGSRCLIATRSLNGKAAELGVRLKRLGPDWKVVGVKKHR